MDIGEDQHAAALLVQGAAALDTTMLRRSRRTDNEVEAFKLSLGTPQCEMIGCLGLNDDVPDGVEGINCLTYQTETGTRVVWLCDTHVATATDPEGNLLDIGVREDRGEWKKR